MTDPFYQPRPDPEDPLSSSDALDLSRQILGGADEFATLPSRREREFFRSTYLSGNPHDLPPGAIAFLEHLLDARPECPLFSPDTWEMFWKHFHLLKDVSWDAENKWLVFKLSEGEKTLKIAPQLDEEGILSALDPYRSRLDDAQWEMVRRALTTQPSPPGQLEAIVDVRSLPEGAVEILTVRGGKTVLRSPQDYMAFTDRHREEISAIPADLLPLFLHLLSENPMIYERRGFVSGITIDPDFGFVCVEFAEGEAVTLHRRGTKDSQLEWWQSKLAALPEDVRVYLHDVILGEEPIPAPIVRMGGADQSTFHLVGGAKGVEVDDEGRIVVATARGGREYLYPPMSGAEFIESAVFREASFDDDFRRELERHLRDKVPWFVRRGFVTNLGVLDGGVLAISTHLGEGCVYFLPWTKEEFRAELVDSNPFLGKHLWPAIEEIWESDEEAPWRYRGMVKEISVSAGCITMILVDDRSLRFELLEN